MELHGDVAGEETGSKVVKDFVEPEVLNSV